MNNDPLGTLVQQGNIMRVNNALVEETFCFNSSSGYIRISYSVPDADNTVSIQNVQLNINNNTVILDLFEESLCPCCIQEGMLIDAIFSSRMTRSIPPQSNAYLIIVKQWPQIPSSVTTNRIAFIDTDNNFLYTGDPNDINTQTRFVITDETSIIDPNGEDISLDMLTPGQLVRITHATFQTASIPPQTTAFDVQVIRN